MSKSDDMKLSMAPYDLDDELLARTRTTNTAQVRVLRWQGVAVVIGRGGKAELELNASSILADGVPVLRRPGGGCSVVLDPGNLVVSVGLPMPGISNIKKGFAQISDWLIDALEHCGVPGVRQEGISDLTLGDLKIGGSCIYRTRNLLYYSTTLLVQPDLDQVSRYLSHPPREPDYRRGRCHRDFMASLAGLGLADDADALAVCLERRLVAGLDELANNTGC